MIRMLMCSHENKRLVRQIFGDEINHRNGTRSMWRCESCGKWFNSRRLSECIK